MNGTPDAPAAGRREAPVGDLVKPASEKAAVDCGGAAAVHRLTGTWPD
ncbi:hypothetical protein [Streptomyces sp. RKND-216]|nr:hypothetical protein [Streptomyces sp. RKND-216]